MASSLIIAFSDNVLRTSGCLVWIEEDGSGSGQDCPKGFNLFNRLWQQLSNSWQMLDKVAGQDGLRSERA